MISALLIAFLLYSLILVAIGYFTYMPAADSDQFLLGGRKINYWITAISAHASDMSSWLFIGFPVAVYTNGLFECWAAIGLLLGAWGTWHYVAPQIRSQSAQTNSITFSSFLAAQAGDRTRRVQYVSGLITLFFFLFYIASGLKGIGTVLDATFGINYTLGTCCGALLVIFYIMLGGYTTIAWTDFFQGVFLLIMIILVPIRAYSMITPESISAFDLSVSPPLSLLPHGKSLIDAIILAASWGLGYFGLPHVLTKFMGIDDTKNIKKAQYVGLTWQLITLTAALLIGLVAVPYFNGALLNPEHLFTTMVHELFHPLLGGFILCAILAATISTVDSQILVACATLSHDLFPGGPSRTERASLWYTRISIVIITGIALVIALNVTDTLYSIVRYAWSGLGSTFSPLVLCSLYYKKLTPEGALAGMLTGGLVAGIWPYTGLFLDTAPLIPGFFTSLAAIIVVSHIRRNLR